MPAIETVLLLACAALALMPLLPRKPEGVRVAQESRVHGKPGRRGRS